MFLGLYILCGFSYLFLFLQKSILNLHSYSCYLDLSYKCDVDYNSSTCSLGKSGSRISWRESGDRLNFGSEWSVAAGQVKLSDALRIFLIYVIITNGQIVKKMFILDMG